MLSKEAGLRNARQKRTQKSPDRKSIVIAVTIDYQLQYHDGLFGELAADGWNVHVVSTPGENLDRIGRCRSVTAHPVNMTRGPTPFKDLVGFLKLTILLARLRPDIFFVGTPKASVLGLAAAVIAGVSRRIYMVHGLRLEGSQGWRRRLLRLIERLVCAMASDVIPVSGSLSKRITGELRVAQKKVRVLDGGSCNGVDTSLFQGGNRADHPEAPAELRNARSPIVGFVGRLTRDKGLPELASAMAIMFREGFRVTLLVVGPVDDPSGAEGIRLLKASRQTIITTGFVDELEKLYPYMDALVLPSLREGLPNVVLEAFASKTIVIGTSVTGIIDLVSDGVTGLLVPPKDPVPLAAAIRLAIDDQAASARMTLAALKLVCEKYEKKHVLRKQVEYFNLLLRHGG